jgi:hypothetical protein
VFVQSMELNIKIRGSDYDAAAQKRGDREKENWERRGHCYHEKTSSPPPKWCTSIIVTPWPSSWSIGCVLPKGAVAGAKRILHRPGPDTITAIFQYCNFKNSTCVEAKPESETYIIRLVQRDEPCQMCSCICWPWGGLGGVD